MSTITDDGCVAPEGLRKQWICRGDIWRDRDYRGPIREIRVVDTSNPLGKVLVETTTGYKKGRRTEIRFDRMRPTSTGYRLVEKVCSTHGETS